MDYYTIISKFDGSKRPSLVLGTILTKLKNSQVQVSMKQLKEFIISDEKLKGLLDGETLRNPNYQEEESKDIEPPKQKKTSRAKKDPENDLIDAEQPKPQKVTKAKKATKSSEDSEVQKPVKTPRVLKSKKQNDIQEIQLDEHLGKGILSEDLMPFQKTSSKQTDFMLEMKEKYPFCNEIEFENLLPKIISFVDNYLKQQTLKFDQNKLNFYLESVGIDEPCECDTINIIFTAIRFIDQFKTQSEYVINKFLEIISRITLQFCNSSSDESSISDFKRKFLESKAIIHGLVFDNELPLEYRNKSEVYYMTNE